MPMQRGMHKRCQGVGRRESVAARELYGLFGECQRLRKVAADAVEIRQPGQAQSPFFF